MMTNATIYNLAMPELMRRLRHEEEYREKAIAIGAPHKIADKRISKLREMERELRQMIQASEAIAE